jgi:UDP-glucose 4-epimerase
MPRGRRGGEVSGARKSHALIPPFRRWNSPRRCNIAELKSLRGARVLITGGAGMIGSTLAHLAAGQGARVTVLDAMLPLYGGNPFNLQGIADRIEFIAGDIRDFDLIKRAVAGADYIFSLAAQVSYVDSNIEPLLDLDINCHGHLNLLNACVQANREAKIVFTSSRFVYGTIEYNPVDEAHPFNCLSIYGIHKLAGEKYYRFYRDAHRLQTVSLRISNPYGPRQQMKHSKYGIVNWFIRLALAGQPLTVYGDGRQKRDYIFVEDVAEGLLRAALTPETEGQVYNLGSGVGTPFIDMARCVADLLPGTVVQQVEWPADRYFVETGDYISDITRLTQALAWTPKTSIVEGIAQTIGFYRRHQSHYW